MFLDHFDVLMSKIIFFKKNIILIYFRVKKHFEKQPQPHSNTLALFCIKLFIKKLLFTVIFVCKIFFFKNIKLCKIFYDQSLHLIHLL